MIKRGIIFGTDGIRGNADCYPFTNRALFDLGSAIAQWARQKYNKENIKVLIGHDTRVSCERIKKALINGLTTYDSELIDVGVIPTPAILRLMSHDQSYDVGIMISASHNPYHDNGIKIFDKLNGKLLLEDEQCIASCFNQAALADETLVPHVFKDELAHVVWSDASLHYISVLASYFPAKLFAGLRIALDCAHGATSSIAPEIFRRLGAQVITRAAEPDGYNINDDCGAVHPEKLRQLVLSSGADLGFAFDGDGDRLVFVTKNGDIKDGDDIMCLLLTHPSYTSLNTVVGTVMTNYGFERHLEQVAKQLVRVKVGDKYVADALSNHNLLLGGETSGHVIINDYLPTGDGIFVALRVLETIIMTKNWDGKTFEKYPQVLVNVPVEYTRDLTQGPCEYFIDQQRKKLQNGRIIVRYSGTEPLLRIMVEDQKYESAYTIAHTLAHQLRIAITEGN